MCSEQGGKEPSNHRKIVAGALFAGLSLFFGAVHAATVTELIDKARQEGAVSVTVTSSMTGKTTPEAESIWQPELFLTHFLWGESDVDRKTRQDMQQSGAKIVDFLSTEKGRELLAWYATEEGRKYRQAIGRAIKGE